MEPLLLTEPTAALADTTAEIAHSMATIGSKLHPATLSGLANLVRLMNCYYSNLIEGHPTKPRDIDAALKKGGNEETSQVPGDDKRERLLKLALAHIRTQKWIDEMHLGGNLPDPSSQEFIVEVHRRFYKGLPESFLEIEDPKTRNVVRRMEPGRYRGIGEDVSVGNHIPPSGGEPVQAFMNAYSARYKSLRGEKIGISQRLCGIAAAHHRLLYIHPFDDGNGRVARLLAHAMMLDAGLGAHGLWSVSRGLARGIRHDAPRKPKILQSCTEVPATNQYKFMMAYADNPRQGDLDGRGNLSQKALQDFCDWFLATALDQIKFMSSQFKFDELSEGLVKYYVPRRRLDEKCGRVLSEIVRLGEIPRSTVRAILVIPARTASNVIARLIDDGIVISDGHNKPLRLNFGPDAAEILFPNLFGVEALSTPLESDAEQAVKVEAL